MAEKAYEKAAPVNHMSSEKRTLAHPRRWWILAIVSIGTFLTNLDVSIASIACPTLSAEFHVSITVVQWVMSAYLLTICALLPIAGKLSDLFGKGRLYNFGFLIFTVGSCLSALSFTFIMLIGAKVIQALGGVLVMANTQAIVAVTFEAKERGRALGIAGIAVSLGVLSGPGLGGFLIEHFGWPSIFWVNVPIGLLGFAAGLWVMPKERTSQTKEPFDYFGSVLFMTGMTTLLYTVSSMENQGWTSWQNIMGLLRGCSGFGVILSLGDTNSLPDVGFFLVSDQGVSNKYCDGLSFGRGNVLRNYLNAILSPRYPVVVTRGNWICDVHLSVDDGSDRTASWLVVRSIWLVFFNLRWTRANWTWICCTDFFINRK